jgi:hypothetical protein
LSSRLAPRSSPEPTSTCTSTSSNNQSDVLFLTACTHLSSVSDPFKWMLTVQHRLSEFTVIVSHPGRMREHYVPTSSHFIAK